MPGLQKRTLITISIHIKDYITIKPTPVESALFVVVCSLLIYL